MIKLFHTLLGRMEHDDTIVAQKSEEAHNIKNEIQKDVIDVMEEIQRVGADSRNQLKQLTTKIGVVSQQIAIATGGKGRGL